MGHKQYNVSDKRKKFYDSAMWKRTKRAVYIRAKGCCEICGNPGTEVHHKIELDDQNVDDPKIALGMDNLILLCTQCHNKQRHRRNGAGNRCTFDADGNVTIEGGSKNQI